MLRIRTVRVLRSRRERPLSHTRRSAPGARGSSRSKAIPPPPECASPPTQEDEETRSSLPADVRNQQRALARVRSGLTSKATVRANLFVINQTRGDTRGDEFHQNSHEPIERERGRNRQNHVPAEAVHHGQHDSDIQAVAKPLPQARLAFLVALHVDQREEWCEYQYPYPEDPHHLLHLGFRAPHRSRLPVHVRQEHA